MRKHWVFSLVACLCLVVCNAVACGTPQPPPANTVACPLDTLRQINSLQQAPLPEHLLVKGAARTGDEFDVNEYFDVLTHLSMEPGYVLDYVYFKVSSGGEPVLYARPASEPGYATYEEYEEKHSGQRRGDHMKHIQIDGTPEGFVEYIVLRIKGGQFYEYWHGYDETQISCNPAGIEARVSRLPNCTRNDNTGCMSRKHKKAALAMEVKPTVEFESDTVTVSVVLFSEFGGYSRRFYTIRREFPHEVLKTETEGLVPYDSGVRY